MTSNLRSTVLVVEDDRVLGDLMAEVLEGEGYAVLQACDAQQGLRLAQEHEPDLILTDQVLPDLSGLELLDRLRTRASTRRIPVVIVSGLPVAENDGAQADGVLSKPFDIDLLVAHVTRAVRGRVAVGSA
jgi:DNA-binding response OmpR family regulator